MREYVAIGAHNNKFKVIWRMSVKDAYFSFYNLYGEEPFVILNKAEHYKGYNRVLRCRK